jgi:hypothetical protein
MLLLAVVLTRVERTAPEQLVSDELASKRMALRGNYYGEEISTRAMLFACRKAPVGAR